MLKPPLKTLWIAVSAISVFGGLALSGCGRPARPPVAPPKASESAPLTGSLTENVQKIQSNKWAESCDRDQDTFKRELATALDSKQTEIQKYLAAPKPASDPSSSLYRNVSVGPTYLREQIKTPDAKVGWQEDRYSWKSIHSEFLEIKEKSVAEHGRDWAWLDSQVRSLIRDDLDRLNGQNLFLNKDSGPALSNAIATLDLCLERADCDQLEFSPETEIFIGSNYYYSENRDWIRSQPDLTKKRETIAKVRGYMNNDYERFRFIPNANVRLEADGTFILPLQAGPWGDTGSQNLLAKYIENIWSRPDARVKVQWVDSSSTPAPFSFLLGAAAGERAYVIPDKREIHLFPGTRDKTVAHEIGHVLGFTDHYYTVWQPRGCKYVVQSNGADLMSESETGVVTNEEWNELRKHYSLAPTPST